MKIYTKTGDNGTTALANGERVPKTDLRIEAYGTADELNAFIGVLQSKLTQLSGNGTVCDDAREMQCWAERLQQLQNKLFNAGAALAGAQGVWISQQDVAELEQWIDEIQDSLEPLHAFLLPGGSEEIAAAHVCRTITRRLERQVVALNDHSQQMNNLSEWINRLSDFFFVLARKVSKMQKKTTFLWKK